MSRSSRFWVITAFGAGVAALAVVGAYLLFDSQAGGSSDPKVRIDVLRSALTVGAGTGGVFALVLAFRKQWHTEHESKQRHILDQHGQAMEQLGSDKAPVRIGALYSLERLANEHPELRPVVVNELCAYLRMPSPFEQKPKPESKKEIEEEGNVRKTVQRLLEKHLRTDAEHYWAHEQIDLFGADFETSIDFSECVLHNANFDVSQTYNEASFRGAVFTGKYASFFDVDFSDRADFESARFNTKVDFRDARAKVWNFNEAVVCLTNVLPRSVPPGWTVTSDADSTFGLFHQLTPEADT